jgi:hypothetical protein
MIRQAKLRDAEAKLRAALRGAAPQLMSLKKAIERFQVKAAAAIAETTRKLEAMGK